MIDVTFEEYKEIDILDKLEQAIATIVNDNGPDPHNLTVYRIKDEGTELQVSDMLGDAIVTIRRLRGELQIDL